MSLIYSSKASTVEVFGEDYLVCASKSSPSGDQSSNNSLLQKVLGRNSVESSKYLGSFTDSVLLNALYESKQSEKSYT